MPLAQEDPPAPRGQVGRVAASSLTSEVTLGLLLTFVNFVFHL